MNFNEVRELAQREFAKRTQQPAIGPREAQHAELAMQVMGHPAWDAFHVHIQELLHDTKLALGTLKDRWALSYNRPDEDAFMHQQATAFQARISALQEVLEYLPSLVKKVSPDAN